VKGKGSPYSITERRAPELIPVLGSQFAGDVSHKPGDRLPLLSVRSTVTLATLKRHSRRQGLKSGTAQLKERGPGRRLATSHFIQKNSV